MAVWVLGLVCACCQAPAAPLPEGLVNLAAASRGAKVVRTSSTYGALWTAENLIDGRLTTGWGSEDGRTKNEFVIIQFADKKLHKVCAVGICPSATGHLPAANASLRGFRIQVSKTTLSPESFHTVLRGKCVNRREVQVFQFEPVEARYVKLSVLSNFGHPGWVEIAELEVLGPPPAEAVETTNQPSSAETAPTPAPARATEARSAPSGPPLPEAGGSVLIDTRGWGAAGGLISFRARLAEAGFVVKTTSETADSERPALTPKLLAGAEVVVLHLRESFAPGELQAIQDYVQDGGSLLVSVASATGKSDFLWGANALLRCFSTAVSEGLKSGPTTFLSRYHPVTRDLQQLVVGERSVAVWSRRLMSLAQVEEQVVAAVGEYEAGRVAVVAADLISDAQDSEAHIAASDNAAFAVNLVRWLSAPSSD